MDFEEILKDKKTWIVGGGAALVGLVVFLKRGSSGSGTPSTSSAASGVPATGAVTANTTGTDIASYLAQVSQQNQDQFNQWGQNLTDTLKAIQGAGTTMTGTSGATGGSYTRNSDGTYNVGITGGTNWSDLQAQLAGFNLNADRQTLINLNPGLMSDVNTQNVGGTWLNFFKNPVTVKVPVLNPPKS